MQYYTLKIKDKEYKCKLNAKACVELERNLKTNPLNVMAKVASSNEIPELEILIEILHASLQAYQHKITMDDTYEIYDKYIEEGNTLIDFMNVIIEIFKVSGFFNEDNGKN